MKVLFLQGTLSPFFKRFSKALVLQNIENWQVTFNGGDWLFSSKANRIDYRDGIEFWPTFLSKLIRDRGITHVIVYGDCRVYHQIASEVCLQLNVHFHVFEGGYIRPNYVTFEEHGANANSKITRDSVNRWQWQQIEEPIQATTGFWKLTWYAAVYYLTMGVLAPRYRRYVHHRGFSAVHEGFCWWRAGIRKWLYKLTEPNALKKLKNKPFFVVPLQVYNDAQITHHSPFDSMEDFIRKAMTSFAQHADTGDHLVIKHHPMDKGHQNYRLFIRKLALELNVLERVMYVHDQNLPALLDICKGVVSINSTTVISAFHHNAPVLILGDAFYNMEGLSDCGRLEQFWRNPKAPDPVFYSKFREYIRAQNQINGDFYDYSGLVIRESIAKLIGSNREAIPSNPEYRKAS